MNMRNDEWPTISIVIVNLNGKKWVKVLAESISNTDYPTNKIEIILVDNGSVDGSVELIKKFLKNNKRLRIIQNDKNVGWSPANNQGMKIAKNEIVICLSNDMQVDPNWLKEIVNVMRSNNSIGIIQCNSISIFDKKSPDSGMNYLDKFGFSYSYAPLKYPAEVFFAEGMAFAIKQEVIKRIGVLDSYFFMEYDDMDYSWRARLLNYKVFFAPAAIVYHARGGTVGSTYFNRVKNVKWYTRNHIVTLIKNYQWTTLINSLTVVLTVESIKILYLLIAKKKPILAHSALNGLLDVLKDLPIIMQKRKFVQKTRRVSDKIIINSMHKFNPWLLRLFLVEQSIGKRLAIPGKPSLNKG